MRRPGRLGSTHGDREAPAWHRRGRPFFRLWLRLPDRDGTEYGRALNGIVCRWRANKSGCATRGVPGDELRSVSVIGGQDFDCVSVTGWPWPISMESGGRAAAPRLLFLGAATLLKFDDLRVRLIAHVLFLIPDFFHKPVVLNTCLNSICSYYL